MTERPSQLDVLKGMVTLVASRSTCKRGSNGAIIYDDKGVLVRSGYNGALSGQDHCEHPCSCGYFDNPISGQWHMDGCTFKKPCRISVHAEANAILWCAREGVRVAGMSMVTTTSPCYNCSQMIVQSGIKHVEYLRPYRMAEGVQLLWSSGVTVSGPPFEDTP